MMRLTSLRLSAAAIREQNIFAQNARREFALPQKFDGAARVIDRRVASRGGHFNEIAEQSREALHFRGITRKCNGIASNRDARGKRPLHLAQHAIGRAHDLLHAHPFGQRKRDLRFVGRDGIVAHESPFDVHLQNDFIVSKHIEALVKGSSKQGGWENDVVRNGHSVRFRRNPNSTRRAHSTHRVSRLIKRFRKRRRRRHSSIGETRAHRRSLAASGHRKARCAG